MFTVPAPSEKLFSGRLRIGTVKKNYRILVFKGKLEDKYILVPRVSSKFIGKNSCKKTSLHSELRVKTLFTAC